MARMSVVCIVVGIMGLAAAEFRPKEFRPKEFRPKRAGQAAARPGGTDQLNDASGRAAAILVTKVAVIAPTMATRREAVAVLRRNGWVEVNPRQADGVLAVVRSSLLFPLEGHYNAYTELEAAAELWGGVFGEYLHVYVFRIEENLTVTEIAHTRLKAED